MRKSVLFTVVVLMLAALALTACGGGGSGAEGPDAANGEKLYNQATLGSNSAEGCASCHAFDASEGDETDAPFTAGVATRAESAVPGLSAEEYLLESIVNPDAYVVEGFNAGDMYATWEAELTEQQIADLVAYLLTVK